MSNKNLLYPKNDGFILLGSSIALFIILSIFSIFLIRIVVKENQISNYNIADIKARNLAQSGLDHGIKIFKNSKSPYLAPVTKNFNDGEYTITYNPTNTENGTPLPYSHFAMIKSSASINNAQREARVFVSSYPNAFNLAFFGNRTGQDLKTLYFDGINDYVSTSIGNYFGQNKAMSVQAWVNITANSNGPILTITNTPPGGGWNMPFLSINGTTVYGWIWGVNGNQPLSYNASAGWHRLTLTYDPSSSPNLKFYVNGNKVAYGSGQYSSSNSSVYWTTYNPGAKPSGVNSYLKGEIDDVSIWNKTLTENEVNTMDYISGDESGLAGYWNFNEESGNVIIDNSYNSNNGTISGAVRSTSVDSKNEDLTQSGGTINGDIYYNGDVPSLTQNGVAYTSNGLGGSQHPSPLPEFPVVNTNYFTNILNSISPAQGDVNIVNQETVLGQIITLTNGRVYASVDPHPWINYTPSGAPNWWQIRVQFQKVDGTNEFWSKTYGENTNNGNKYFNWGTWNGYTQLLVKNIYIRGDFSHPNEHLRNVTIGGNNQVINVFGNTITVNTGGHNFGTMYGNGDNGNWHLEYSSGGGGESNCSGCITKTYGENTKNQTRSWSWNLGSSFSAGDKVNIRNIWIRGDVDGNSEYLNNVKIGGHNFGRIDGNCDCGTWYKGWSGNKTINKSGSTVSASAFISNEVHYTPGGTSNWWAVKAEFSPAEYSETSLSITNDFNLNDSYPDGLLYGEDIFFDGINITGSGKIFSTGNITITNCNISGGIELVSSGNIIINNNNSNFLGSNISSISNSIVIFSGNQLIINGGTIKGLIINKGSGLNISNANIEGAIYTESYNTNINSSTIIGSIVSQYGGDFINSHISKGPLPPLYDTPYGFDPMIVPGSYLEF